MVEFALDTESAAGGTRLDETEVSASTVDGGCDSLVGWCLHRVNPRGGKAPQGALLEVRPPSSPQVVREIGVGESVSLAMKALVASIESLLWVLFAILKNGRKNKGETIGSAEVKDKSGS